MPVGFPIHLNPYFFSANKERSRWYKAKHMKSLLKIALKFVAAVVVLSVLVSAIVGWWFYSQLTGSLPRLDGEIVVHGVSAPVTITRDTLGIPRIEAANRLDLAFATGFVHGQDRFFQMDLLRRNAAGELSELVGSAALDHDREMRRHRFRARAQAMAEVADDAQKALLEAYTQGVNAGLKSLATKPPEYLFAVLDTEPEPWKVEDAALVLFSMYLDLQWDDFKQECRYGLMLETLPKELVAFLIPPGSQWDAPVEGDPLPAPSYPAADVIDIHTDEARAALQQTASSESVLDDLAAVEHFAAFVPGSNNWAVAGEHTAHGGAIVANDMHLGISVPGIWYRASLHWTDEDDQPREITGVTLPGTPAMVVGSNAHIAWAFTNSEGDWLDVVLLDPVPGDDDAYQTPDGPRKFEHHKETIRALRSADETLDVLETIWGPVIDTDHQGRRRVARWVAHDTEGVNLNLLDLETCDSAEEALTLAALSGSPAQNFVVGDDSGNIAWTILGRIPRRPDLDGRIPASWADGQRQWQGWLDPKDYPRIVAPPDGRIWTANARVVGGEKLAILRDGGYDLGARAGQIRDDLLKLDKATERDMLDIQLDDRAVFLSRWQAQLLKLLDDEATDGHPNRDAARGFVEDWGSRAAIDSVGYRIVRGYRLRVLKAVCQSLTAPCRELDPEFKVPWAGKVEGPVWQLITEQPEHLLDPQYASWNDLMLAALDKELEELTSDGRPLAKQTWGAYNTTRIQHPLSKAVPELGAWLDMPAEQLPGGSSNLPRIQRPSSGASQRMAVSPGREAEGYMEIPCGQSGHFLSPNYADSHPAWTGGKASSFLPGEAVHTLELKPGG